LRGRFSSLVLRPGYPLRFFWDILSNICTTYDALYTPLKVFSFSVSEYSCSMSLVMACFWTLDIGVSFLTGFNKGGIEDLRLKKIALRYLKTWFVLDVFVVGVDWVTLECRHVGGFRRLQISKLFRLMRIILRIWRSMRFVARQMDRIHSEAVVTLVGVAKFIGFIVFVSHFIACGWYFVGQVYAENGADSWVAHLKLNSRHVPSDLFFYTTALHWALTQFTPASMEIMPRNSVERIFAVVVLVVAVVVFSSFLSSITNAMMHLRKVSEDSTRQKLRAHRYIAERRVSVTLSEKIRGFLQVHGYVAPVSRLLREADVLAFKNLPESMLVSLRHEVHGHKLVHHPLFAEIEGCDLSAMLNICNALEEVTLVPKQELFREQAEAAHIFCIIQGCANYIPSCQDFKKIKIAVRHFLSEAALWTLWHHRGTLEATTCCNVVAMKSQGFQKSMANSVLMPILQSYARRYMEELTLYVDRDFGDLWEVKTAEEMVHQAREDAQVRCSPKHVRFTQILSDGTEGSTGRSSTRSFLSQFRRTAGSPSSQLSAIPQKGRLA